MSSTTGPHPAGAAPTRVVFMSDDTQLVGYHHAPASTSQPAPLIVMAHGLGGLQASLLPAIAARFAAAGYHALTFDYRTWGESDGRPRNVLDLIGQQYDYRSAVAFGRTLPGVDADRIVLWGSSLSGGHVLELGAELSRLVGVIAQVPHVSGFATVRALPIRSLVPLTFAGLVDVVRDALPWRMAPRYVPLAAEPGELGGLSQPGAADGYAFVQPNPPAPGNVMAARLVLNLPFYNPASTAHRSQVPTWIGVGTDDNVTPPAPTIALAKRMGATLGTYPGGHFCAYPGAEQFEAVFADQLAFLAANVPLCLV